MLVALVVHGLVTADLSELLRIADSPDYRVGAELRALLEEAKLSGETNV